MKYFCILFIPAFLLTVAPPIFAQTVGKVVRERNSYGYQLNDKWIIKPKYDSIRPFFNSRAAVLRKGKWGFVNEKGKVVISIKYPEVNDFGGGLASVKLKDKQGWYIIDNKGNLKDKELYYKNADSVYNHNYYNKIAHVDSITIAQEILPRRFDTVITIWKYPGTKIYSRISSVRKINNVLVLKYRKDFQNSEKPENFQLINLYGKALTPIILCDSDLLKKLSIITDSKTWQRALINANAELSEWFDNIVKLDENYFKVSKKGKHGVINNKFEMVIQPLYSDIKKTTEGFIIIDNGKYGAINAQFKMVVQPIYTNVQSAGKGFIVKDGKQSFLADSNGAKISESFKEMIYLNEGFCSAKKGIKGADYLDDPVKVTIMRLGKNSHIRDSTVFLINNKGKIVGQYAFVFLFKNGFARVINDQDNTQYAYINRQGKLITQWYTRRETAKTSGGGGFGSFIGGVIAGGFFGISNVRVGGGSASSKDSTQLRYYDFRGYKDNYIYFFGDDFEDNLAVISQKQPLKNFDKYTREYLPNRVNYVYEGVIDTCGKIVMKSKYNNIWKFKNAIIIDSALGKPYDWGLVDLHGKPILSMNNSLIWGILPGYYTVTNFHSKTALYKYDGIQGSFITGFDFNGIYNGNDSLLKIEIGFGYDGTKYGYIDLTGKIVIPAIYFRASEFESGKAKVILTPNTQEFYINTKGKKIE